MGAAPAVLRGAAFVFSFLALCYNGLSMPSLAVEFRTRVL